MELGAKKGARESERESGRNLGRDQGGGFLIRKRKEIPIPSPTFNPIRTLYLDWHSSAMKSKGKESLLSQESLESNRKFCLGQTKGMTQVKSTIHVWIRECSHEFGLRDRRVETLKGCIRFKSSILFPQALSPRLHHH